jgi:hypothetical protein
VRPPRNELERLRDELDSRIAAGPSLMFQAMSFCVQTSFAIQRLHVPQRVEHRRNRDSGDRRTA